MSELLLHITPGQENERGPLYMESVLSSLHALTGKEKVVRLEIGSHDGKVGLFARMHTDAKELFSSQIAAQYPDSDIVEVPDPFIASESQEIVSVTLKLKRPEVFPIRRHPQFDDLLTRVNMDPIASLCSALSRYPSPGMQGHISLTLKPLSGSFRKRSLRFLPLLRKGLSGFSDVYASLFTRIQLARGIKRILLFPFAICMGGFRAWPLFSKIQSDRVTPEHDGATEEEKSASLRSHEREDSVAGARDKVNRLLFLANITVSVIAKKGQEAAARKKAREIASAFQQFSLPQSNSFVPSKIRTVDSISSGRYARIFVLSSEEIATLWHVPTILVQTPNLDRVLSKKLEPPVNLPVIPEEGITVLGESSLQGDRKHFGIRLDDRRRHSYIIGKTGMGKSTLLLNMIGTDIQAGKGVGVIDPHGDLIEVLLRQIPKNRMNDVVIFDPADKDYPLSFNILESPNPDQRPLIASGLMSVFTKLWPDVWSGRMEHILRNTLLALLESDSASMLGIPRMFTDSLYRNKVLSHVSDPLVKSFWESEFSSWSEKYRTEAVAAIQNKIGQLLSTPLIRNIVGQVQSSLDIRHAMDTGKIILVNLSKGKIGEDTSAFIGSMLVTQFQIDAMSRADIPEVERRDFTLYVDEFQNFATESFADILSEARKYRLSLVMANQFVSQLIVGERSTKLRDAVFGNVGSLISFQVGSDDAEQLSLQFEEAVTPNDILSLAKYHAYIRLMIDGVPSKPFSMVTLPPPDVQEDAKRMETVRALSRERYSQPRHIVEEKIGRFAASAKDASVSEKAMDKAKEKEDEERKKAKKKGMSIEDYRQWRDREMWTNDFNALRKKILLGETLTKGEESKKHELQKKLEESGGVPPPSKAMIELEKKNEGKTV